MSAGPCRAGRVSQRRGDATALRRVVSEPVGERADLRDRRRVALHDQAQQQPATVVDRTRADGGRRERARAERERELMGADQPQRAASDQQRQAPLDRRPGAVAQRRQTCRGARQVVVWEVQRRHRCSQRCPASSALTRDRSHKAGSQPDLHQMGVRSLP
jgi:hypothetical protein